MSRAALIAAALDALEAQAPFLRQSWGTWIAAHPAAPGPAAQALFFRWGQATMAALPSAAPALQHAPPRATWEALLAAAAPALAEADCSALQAQITTAFKDSL